MKRTGVLAILFWVMGNFAHSQVWQWAEDVPGGRHRSGPARAYLWIPPECERVRGIVFAQHNMEELSILEHPVFREEMSRLGFAEVWVSPPFSLVFNFKEGAGESFGRMMDALAESSGYEELRYAPVVGLGHSAAASAPYYFAAWNPARTLAAISVSGQWPYFRHPLFAPDIWDGKTIDYIPCLETMGEYEAADTWSAEGLKERQEHPLLPLSMLACPAEGHFATSDEKVAYLAFYIKKAAQYRLTDRLTSEGVPVLTPIDPTKTGWLADKWRLNELPAAAPAPVGQYRGDPAEAFWYFDEEHARVTAAYQARYRNKKAQLLGVVQQGRTVPQRNTHQQVDLKFLPEADGVTFRLEPVFLDTVPGQSPRPADWTGLPAGSALMHSGDRAGITIEKIIGPFEQTGKNTFRIAMQRGIVPRLVRSPGGGFYELWFAIRHPGDEVYKPAVQQARMVIPAINEAGRPQKINFRKIKDQEAGSRPVKLRAKSDAGLPVRFYVREGPAKISGNRLTFTRIPPRSRFPVKVTVVAWQWGRNTEPCYQSAEPVIRTFYIQK